MTWSMRICSEDELEVLTCEECGSDNVLCTSANCETCRDWREKILAVRPGLADLVKLY